MMCLRWPLDCCVCPPDVVDAGSEALHNFAVLHFPCAVGLQC